MSPARTTTRKSQVAAADKAYGSSGGTGAGTDVRSGTGLRSTQFALLGLSFQAANPEGKLAAGPLLLERSASETSDALLPWPPLDRLRLLFDRGAADWLRQEVLGFFLDASSQCADPLAPPGTVLSFTGVHSAAGAEDGAPLASTAPTASTAPNTSGSVTVNRLGGKACGSWLPLELMESACEQGAWLAQHRVVLEQLGVRPDTFRSFEGHAATKRRPQPKIIGSNNVEPVQEAFSSQSNAVREDPGWLRSPETAHRIERGSALRRHSRAPGVDDERTLSSDESRSPSTDRDTLDSSELDSDWTMDTFDDDESYEADEAFATAAEREAVF